MDNRFFMQYLQSNPHDKALLVEIYDRMQDECLDKTVFYDGTVTNAREFLDDILRIGSLPFAVYWEGILAGFTWFNSVEGKSCRGHFVFFKNVWGRKTTAIIGRNIFEYILNKKDDKGYFFDVILGIIPCSNTLAWKLSTLTGRIEVGRIPNGVFIAERGRSEDAMMGVVTRDSLALNY